MSTAQKEAVAAGSWLPETGEGWDRTGRLPVRQRQAVSGKAGDPIRDSPQVRENKDSEKLNLKQSVYRKEYLMVTGLVFVRHSEHSSPDLEFQHLQPFHASCLQCQLLYPLKMINLFLTCLSAFIPFGSIYCVPNSESEF